MEDHSRKDIERIRKNEKLTMILEVRSEQRERKFSSCTRGSRDLRGSTWIPEGRFPTESPLRESINWERRSGKFFLFYELDGDVANKCRHLCELIEEHIHRNHIRQQYVKN